MSDTHFWVCVRNGADSGELKRVIRNEFGFGPHDVSVNDLDDVRRAVWEWIGMQDRHRVWDLVETLETIGFPCPDDVRRRP